MHVEVEKHGRTLSLSLWDPEMNVSVRRWGVLEEDLLLAGSCRRIWWLCFEVRSWRVWILKLYVIQIMLDMSTSYKNMGVQHWWPLCLGVPTTWTWRFHTAVKRSLRNFKLLWCFQESSVLLESTRSTSFSCCGYLSSRTCITYGIFEFLQLAILLGRWTRNNGPDRRYLQTPGSTTGSGSGATMTGWSLGSLDCQEHPGEHFGALLLRDSSVARTGEQQITACYSLWSTLSINKIFIRQI